MRATLAMLGALAALGCTKSTAVKPEDVPATEAPSAAEKPAEDAPAPDKSPTAGKPPDESSASEKSPTAARPGEGAPATETPPGAAKPAEDASTPKKSPGVGAAGGPLSGLLLPPGTPGESNVKLEGCLAQAAPTEESGSRFPARAGSRSARTGPAAQISTLAGGVLITHELSHACCLKAAVISKLEGQNVTVREKLSGSPCRCMCQSTVRAAVGLAKGHYRLTLVQEGNGPTVNVAQQEVDVP